MQSIRRNGGVLRSVISGLVLNKHTMIKNTHTFGVRFMGAGGGGGGPDMPEFGAQAPPKKQLPFDNDLIWHDSTAPETIVDFDAQHISTAQAVASFFAAFGVLGTIYAYCVLHDPPSAADVVSVAYSAPEGQSALDMGLTEYTYGSKKNTIDE
jgi:hypothetical protein